MPAPQPEEIYERTRREGERRLARPFLEVMSTALAAGFDIVAGLTAFTLVGREIVHLDEDVAHLAASAAFGLAFVFLVVGRGELFTENFLVPLAGLHGKPKRAWLKIGELWTLSPVFNITAGAAMAVLLTVHGVLPKGSAQPLVASAEAVRANGWLALFLSAVFAGALMTAMTWFVEGQESMGVRMAIAWSVGLIIALAPFDHVIVETIALVYAVRFGAHVPYAFIVENVFLAAAGNLVGGVGLVTLNRFTQARSGSGRGTSSA